MAEGPLVLDLHAILRARLPKKVSRLVPGFMISWLAKIVHQRELNEILRMAYPNRGSHFSRKVIEYLDLKVEVEGLENLPDGKRYMFASNHPLGGLDGIALIGVLGDKYGNENIRFLVNDMLMNVEPLRDVFLPVNKFGRQGREASAAINEAMKSDMQIFQFPAGLCSRLQKKGEIADLEWQKSFVAKAIESERDIVPVYFEGRNTRGFYRKAKWRKRLGIKFNLEQILLPGEVCKSRGNHYKIKFGEPISWQGLKESGKPAKELATDIRGIVYSMK